MTRVIIAGDLLDTNSMVEPGTQILVVLKYLERLRGLTRLLVCSGNHDLDALNAAGEKHAGLAVAAAAAGHPDRRRDLDARRHAGDGLPVVGRTGEHATRSGRSSKRRRAQRTGKWLWVYHAPPPDTPVSWGGTRHFGDPALAGWVAQYQPDIVLCGPCA